MIFLSQALGAQSSSASNAAAATDAGSVGGFDESDIDFSSWGGAAASSEGDGGLATAPSLGIGVYVRMVFVLALVVAAIVLIFRFIKKSSGLSGVQDPDETFLRHVSMVPLGQGKGVHIVTLIDKAYILGVSDSAVNLIGEVQDKELVNAMNLFADKRSRTSKPRSFADVLDLFMPRGPRSEGPAPASAPGGLSSSGAEELVEKLRQQSRRLEGEGL